MKKQDLLTPFRRVKTRNGDMHIVANRALFNKYGSYLILSIYSHDLDLLDINENSEFDIIEIYEKPASHLVLDYNYKGKLLWKRQEEMRIAVPYPWMWEEVEKWAFANGVEWLKDYDAREHLQDWHTYSENSFIRIREDKKMQFGSSLIEGDNVISFADFCEKTGHEPKKWGVRGGEGVAPLLHELFSNICQCDFLSPHLLYGMEECGEVFLYSYYDEANEIIIEEAYRKMGKKMPEKQEEEIEIDGKMFSKSTIKNALKDYLK